MMTNANSRPLGGLALLVLALMAQGWMFYLAIGIFAPDGSAEATRGAVGLVLVFEAIAGLVFLAASLHRIERQRQKIIQKIIEAARCPTPAPAAQPRATIYQLHDRRHGCDRRMATYTEAGRR